MKLPEHLFFTGVPGYRWSGIAQDIESIAGVNTTDHTEHREYTHSKFSGHKGAYFGEGMEFSARIEYVPPDDIHAFIGAPWRPGSTGMKIVKSHEWAYKLPLIRHLFPKAWIMLVYRPDFTSYAWWHEAGGFNIKYPDYSSYKTSENMLSEIVKQNKEILAYASMYDAKWSHYSTQWLRSTFNDDSLVVSTPKTDVLVTVIK